MALSRRHRLPLPLVLTFLLAASSHGAPFGNETYDISLCLRQPSTCGTLLINYPFYLYNQTEVLPGYNDSYCGYPGFAIRCEDSKDVILELGNETYRVLDIDYTNMRVFLVYQEIKDEWCPRVNHNVTIPNSSWLSFPNDTVNYLFFLDCPLGSVHSINISPISCGSFGGQEDKLSFVFPENASLPGEFFAVCSRVIKVPVLKLPDSPWNNSQWTNGGFSDAAYSGFRLDWGPKKPSECQLCEHSYAKCAYNQSMEFLGCLCSGGLVEDQKCPVPPPPSSAFSSSPSTGKPFEA